MEQCVQGIGENPFQLKECDQRREWSKSGSEDEGHPGRFLVRQEPMEWFEESRTKAHHLSDRLRVEDVYWANAIVELSSWARVKVTF